MPASSASATAAAANGPGRWVTRWPLRYGRLCGECSRDGAATRSVRVPLLFTPPTVSVRSASCDQRQYGYWAALPLAPAARVAKLADAGGLNPSGAQAPCGFDPRPGHVLTCGAPVTVPPPERSGGSLLGRASHG